MLSNIPTKKIQNELQFTRNKQIIIMKKKLNLISTLCVIVILKGFLMAVFVENGNT